ncbi:LysM domain-containing protein [Aeromonas diversa CDC 2478-85]|uniref:LysM domain-containing protein n=1 Tax=Aeromonas diversa CDC 2478-85 TaxID=1268237 RepID=N9VLG8_9GAMM|nr:LysM domain-containing protein [Aeromonas diversa]ENY72468.1 LysM domain-containing protein [Aeromonas diversa CDC 2478-85]
MNLTRITLIFLLFGSTLGVAAETLALRKGYPQTYTVQRGDTLWDIAGHYLQKPWQWPTLWKGNPQIADPHWIYPGDVLHLTWVDGQPQLSRGMAGAKRVVTLSPHVRSDSKLNPVPALPLSSLAPFLSQELLFSSPKQGETLPYVLGNNEGQQAILDHHPLFVQGLLEPGRQYGAYRPGREYRDPKSGDWLGQEATLTGIVRADMQWSNGQTQATLIANRQEVRQGDRLMPLPGPEIEQALFIPRGAAPILDGIIVDMPNRMSVAGKLDVVLINKGALDHMAPGSVLDVKRPGLAMVKTYGEQPVYRDTTTGFDRAFHSDPTLQLPPESVARVMLFRVYDRMSYGLILQSRDMVRVGYSVDAP